LTPDELALRTLNAEDFGALADLFESCFGIRVGSDYFHWKYRENPAGSAVAFVADAGDRLAAFYGVIPEPWMVGTDEVRVFQSMDTMTHPDFQRRGLFVRLAELTYDQVRAQTGACDLVGIPGPTSLPGFTRKLGWREIFQFDLLTAPAVLIRALGRGRRGRITVETVDHPDERVHMVLRHAQNPGGKAAPRLEGDFFDWRVFGQSPKRLRVALATAPDGPVAVCVYGLTSRRTTLISFVTGRSDVPPRVWFPPLMRFAARHGTVLYTWRPQMPELGRLFRSMGFRSNPLMPATLRQPLSFIVRSDSWRVSGADWADAGSFSLQPLMQD